MARSTTGLEALEAEWSALPFPEEFETGADYARKMHQHSFEFYLQRLRQIDFRGERVLDAGCGTGTWSFAMAVDSAEVHAVDRNPPRIETADWIKERFGIQNVRFEDQDITRLTFPDDAFDAVFCYGVVISYLSLAVVLQELRRVMRPDALLYVCLNGLGWSMYLRDERGRESETHAEMGRAGIYNTVCQAQLADIRNHLVRISSKEDRRNDPAGRTLDGWRQNRLPPETAPKHDGARQVLADVGHSLVPGRKNPLLMAADILEHECGEAFVQLLTDDLASLADGSATDFSHARAGRGYTPDEAEAACRAAGFTQFRWGDEGSLAVGDARSAGSLFDGWYRGHRQVWEFTARASEARRPVARVASAEDSAPSVSWSLGDDRWARRRAPDRCHLRAYPYPYRAALAISNDTDGMSRDSLNALHDFVNGTGATKYGDGLGLEMSDSFWVWSPEGHLSLFHNMPAERDACPAPEAERIAELGQAGFIDSLHGFGAWREEVPLDRDAMRWALERLDSFGLKPSIYVNHGGRGPLDGGGGLHMKHNIGGPWAYYQEGDYPNSASYCRDLLADAGYRYFWTDVFFEREKFGDYRRFRNQRALDRAVQEYDFSRFLNRRDSDDPTVTIPAFPGATHDELNEIRRRIFNETLVPFRARDESQIYCFKRFRGTWPPNSGNFALQVSGDRLDELVEHGGTVVVYQHFGIWQALGTGKGHPSARRTGADVLDAHGVEAFRELAERQSSGHLFVTTTQRLLNYLWVRDNLVFQARQEGDVNVIRLKRVECPVEGVVRLRPGMLEGIAFSVPRTWGKVVIEVDKMSTLPSYERRPDEASDDLDVVYFGWPRLEYPRSDGGKRRGFLRRALGQDHP